MRKFGKQSTAPEKKGESPEKGSGLKSHWCLLSLAVIVVVAFLLRTVFAYGVSADGGFALSGGAAAEYHLHMLENILNGSFALGDSAVNYPYGGDSVYPPLIEFLAAIPAFICSAMGMSTAEAASAGLAVITPILGALTCIPVYLVGKELYDRRIGVVAALIFAFLPLAISTSVFSNGTEYALAAFMVALMSLFMVKAVKGLDASEEGSRKYLVPAIIAGVFLGLAALSWNGFGILLYVPIIAMFVQLFINRFNNRSLTDVLIAYSVIMLIGVLIAAAYYLAAGTFDAYASAPLCISIIAIVFAAIFKALESKPWIVVTPALVIVAAVIVAVLYFFVPGVYDLVFGGVSMYASETIASLINSRVSMSNVASYYGWLTMWMPICLGIYEAYVLAKKDRSSLQIFKTIWLFILFFAVWTTTANAAAVGVVFGVASGAALVKLIAAANLGEYWANMKAAGFPGVFKKLVKPLPFATIVIVACLVIIPNVTYGVDAGMPNNNNPLFGENGNTQFVIKTGEEYPAEMVWDYYADENIDGAMATWIDKTYDAVSLGGFDSVTDTVGNGAVAVSNIVLGEGTAGAVAAMAVRLAYDNPDVLSRIDATVQSYIQDPEKAKAAIRESPSDYGYVNQDMDDEAAVYMASIRYIVDHHSTVDIIDMYQEIASRSGKNIGYVYLDPSMLPLQYNDGSAFSTIAYIGGYSIDSYGAAEQYYSYNTYSGTTVYTDAMYDTFIWKALIGETASEAGYSSSYSYLSALAMADDKVSVSPGIVEGFEVGAWFVKYNPDKRATLSDDGWKYMSAYEAIDKQKTDGGLINYLSSIMVLEFEGYGYDGVKEVQIKDSNGNNVDGATIEVYAYSDFYGKEVLYSSGKSIDGVCEVAIPSIDYNATISIGSVVLGTTGELADAFTVAIGGLNGQVTLGGEKIAAAGMYMSLTNTVTKQVYDNNSVGSPIIDVFGNVNVPNVMPGPYTYTVSNEDGTQVGSGSFVVDDFTLGVDFALNGHKITATVNFPNGLPVEGATVIASNASAGMQFSAVTDETGVAVINALPGTYYMVLANGYANATSTSVTVSSSDRTTTLTAYKANTVSVSGADGNILTVTAGEYSTVTHSDGTKVDLPVGIATDNQLYSFYGCYGDTVYTGVYKSGSSVSISSAAATTVTGTLKNGDNGVSGTVRFISPSGAAVAVSAGSDGKFQVKMPSGTYTIYADNGSDKVFVGTTSVTDNIGDISLVDGRKVTLTLRYDPRTSASSSTNIPFVMSVVDYSYNSNGYTFYGMSNTSGSTSFYVPDNVEVKIAFNELNGTLDNAAFTCTALSQDIEAGTANTTKYIDIKAQNKEGTVKNVMNKVSITGTYPMTMTFYNEDATDVPEADLTYTFSTGEVLLVVPGQYDVVISGSTGAYYKGTGYVYAGSSSLSGVDIVDVSEVTITKGGEDVIVITPAENDDGETGRYFIEGSKYYFEEGYEYYIVSTNGDGEDQKINYGYIDATTTVPASIDVTATAKKITVTGYAGAALDGKLNVAMNDVKAVFDIDEGAYTMALPAGIASIAMSADLTQKIGSMEYRCMDVRTFENIQDGDVLNLNVYSDGIGTDVSEDFTATASIKETFDWTIKVSVEIANLTDSDRNYVVSSGKAWHGATKTVGIPAGDTAEVVIEGIYNAGAVSTGTDGFDVIVAENGGSSSKTVHITQDSVPGDDGVVITTVATGGANDKISAYEYMYAVTFQNTTSTDKVVSFDNIGIIGYGLSLVDAEGLVLDVTSEFVIEGFATETVYIKLLPYKGGDISDVPSISVTVDVGGVTEQIHMDCQSVDFTSDSMTATGDDIHEKRSGTPLGVWILLAIGVLLAIMAAWLGTKRGVFSRRK